MQKKIKNISDIRLKFMISVGGETLEVSLSPGEEQVVEEFSSKSAIFFEKRGLISVTTVETESLEAETEPVEAEFDEVESTVQVEIEEDDAIVVIADSEEGIAKEIEQVAQYISESEEAPTKPKRVYKRKKGPGRPKKRGPKPGSKRKK